jgi:hypothetical protein
VTDKLPKSREMRLAEDIMSEDKDILQALAAADDDGQMAAAREVMERRREALKKLAE